MIMEWLGVLIANLCLNHYNTMPHVFIVQLYYATVVLCCFAVFFLITLVTRHSLVRAKGEVFVLLLLFLPAIRS